VDTQETKSHHLVMVPIVPYHGLASIIPCLMFHFSQNRIQMVELIVVTYEIRVFFEGAQKEVFSSILKKAL